MILGGWGNYPTINAKVLKPSGSDDIKKYFETMSPFIPRGMGRSYGDSSLNETVVSTMGMNRFLGFDSEKGLLTAQCGVTLAEIQEVFVKRGWMLSVTPGTKIVSLGGAIASDVHGKNHHARGSFCDYVISMDLMTPDGNVHTITPKKQEDLFHATCGGMGLTGVILKATIQLKKVESAYIKQRTLKAKNLEEMLELFISTEHYPYSVAWLDLVAKGKKLGRGLLMVGDNASADDVRKSLKKENPLEISLGRKFNVPFQFPSIALNPLSVAAFNFLYYNKIFKKDSESIVSYDSFFYPLDGVKNWNRIYGKRGFVQYQFVVPRKNGREAITKIIERISKSGQASFLDVLKVMGGSNKNYLSFPDEGYTLALDFAMSKNLEVLLQELDSMVMEYGGRFYLTKDSRMDPETFASGFPHGLEKFMALRKKIDPNEKLQSLQSRRLGL